MPPLFELQQDFARALQNGTQPALAFAPGRVTPEAAMEIHRGTIAGVLANALRLVFPTVEKLVGADYFAQAAAAFAKPHGPASAWLSLYGEGFPAFLATQLPAHLSYVADSARFDLALDRAIRQPQSERVFVMDAAVTLAMPTHLAVLELDTPADLIRDAIDDDAALAMLDVTRQRNLLIWRREAQAVVRPVDPAAAAFLNALYATGEAQAGLAAALEHATEARILETIQTEIFAAPFCRVISTQRIAT